MRLRGRTAIAAEARDTGARQRGDHLTQRGRAPRLAGTEIQGLTERVIHVVRTETPAPESKRPGIPGSGEPLPALRQFEFPSLRQAGHAIQSIIDIGNPHRGGLRSHQQTTVRIDSVPRHEGALIREWREGLSEMASGDERLQLNPFETDGYRGTAERHLNPLGCGPAAYAVALIVQPERRPGHGDELAQILILTADDGIALRARIVHRRIHLRDYAGGDHGIGGRLRVAPSVIGREVGHGDAGQPLAGLIEGRELRPFRGGDPYAIIGRAVAVRIDIGEAARDAENLDEPTGGRGHPDAFGPIIKGRRHGATVGEAEEVLCIGDDRLAELHVRGPGRQGLVHCELHSVFIAEGGGQGRRQGCLKRGAHRVFGGPHIESSDRLRTAVREHHRARRTRDKQQRGLSGPHRVRHDTASRDLQVWGGQIDGGDLRVEWNQDHILNEHILPPRHVDLTLDR